ncbi:MAG: PaaI family thioesterase [Bryobacter sp.]
MLAWMKERLAAGKYSAVCDLLGMEVVRVEAGEAEIYMNVNSQMFNPFGTVHGGILCDLADMAMGTAFFTTLEAGEGLATVELKINFLRPAREGRLQAVAKVVHRGRLMGLVECEVKNEEGKLVAKANSTCMVVKDERARQI